MADATLRSGLLCLGACQTVDKLVVWCHAVVRWIRGSAFDVIAWTETGSVLRKL